PRFRDRGVLQPPPAAPAPRQRRGQPLHGPLRSQAARGRAVRGAARFARDHRPLILFARRMTPPLPIDRALRVVTLAAVAALGVLGFVAPDSVLRGGLAWLGFLFFVLSGFGYFVVRAARQLDADFGLRAAWGAALYLALAGVLIAFGVCTRP